MTNKSQQNKEKDAFQEVAETAMKQGEHLQNKGQLCCEEKTSGMAGPKHVTEEGKSSEMSRVAPSQTSDEKEADKEEARVEAKDASKQSKKEQITDPDEAKSEIRKGECECDDRDPDAHLGAVEHDENPANKNRK